MREVTQEVFDEVADRVLADFDNPEGITFSENKARTYLDGNKVIFECDDETDAERVLVAMMLVIGGAA